MAPSGLIISKLGIQASASDTSISGLLCLKVSLPRENDGRPGARWALFSSTPPHLTSPPSIYPLPLPLPASRTPQLRLASKLLSLPTPASYPPSPQSALGGKPYIDISSTTGKIYVVLDPVPSSRKGSRSALASSAAGGPGSGSAGNGSGVKDGRRDWLICMDFQVGYEEGVEEGISKILLPLPKCLDNVIRFQILSPSEGSTGEVNILTEPKLLPLASSAFASPKPSPLPSRQKRRHSSSSIRSTDKGKMKASLAVEEDGWEDGEDLGPDDVPSEESELDYSETDPSEDGGNWLEGRFQSTDLLRLEWSYNPLASSSDVPFLAVCPQWDKRNPSIYVTYSTELASSDTPIQLEVDVPDGWAWSELIFEGDGLRKWKGSDPNEDEDWWGFPRQSALDPDETLDGTEVDDSFATVRKRHTQSGDRTSVKAESDQTTLSRSVPPPPGIGPTHSSASLMRQTLPAPVDMKMEDYSFELSGIEPRDIPKTPSGLRKHSVPSPNSTLVNSALKPGPTKGWTESRYGRNFELHFDETVVGSGRSLVLQGTLVPVSNTLLVSPSIPVKIPFVSLHDHHTSQCQVQCSSARYGNMDTFTSDVELVDVAQSGAFKWSPVEESLGNTQSRPIKGNARVKLHRSIWGVISVLVTFPFPRKGDETGFQFPSSGQDGAVRLIRCTIDGQPTRRAMYVEGDRQNVRLGGLGGGGRVVEVELELTISANGDIALPIFDGEGHMNVELLGDDWDAIESGIQTNLQPTSSPNQYIYAMTSATPPLLRLAPSSSSALPTSVSRSQSRTRTLFSFSTLLNLFMLWLLVSMGQQVQRLRNEVAFVVDETRDLRMYGLGMDRLKDEDEKSGRSAETKDAPRMTEGRPVEIDRQRADLDSSVPPSSSSTSNRDKGKVVKGTEDEYGRVNGQDLSMPHDQLSVPFDCEQEEAKPSVRESREVVVSDKSSRSYPLSRVVWSVERGWERWIMHPTVKTITKGVSWVWETVVWLVVPY